MGKKPQNRAFIIKIKINKLEVITMELYVYIIFDIK